MVKITAILNTYNEGHLLEKCLDSIKNYVDEIIITDMNSDDNSKYIAERYGAKVISIERCLIVEKTILQKIKLARNDWIFALDPDMVIPEATWIKIFDILKSNKYDVIVFHYWNYVLGKWLKFGHGSGCYASRLFNKKCLMNKMEIEEGIHLFFYENLKKCKKFYLSKKYPILHYAYDNILKMMQQHLNYAISEANEYYSKGYKTSFTKIIFLLLKHLLKNLIFKLGLIEGPRGIIYILITFIMILQRELYLYAKIKYKQ